jgi:hypothetical protein
MAVLRSAGGHQRERVALIGVRGVASGFLTTPAMRRSVPAPLVPSTGRRAVPPHSWLPGTGLNLMPRKASPTGFAFAASIVIAVQMTFVEVAAIAVVP